MVENVQRKWFISTHVEDKKEQWFYRMNIDFKKLHVHVKRRPDVSTNNRCVVAMAVAVTTPLYWKRQFFNDSFSSFLLKIIASKPTNSNNNQTKPKKLIHFQLIAFTIIFHCCNYLLSHLQCTRHTHSARIYTWSERDEKKICEHFVNICVVIRFCISI